MTFDSYGVSPRARNARGEAPRALSTAPKIDLVSLVLLERLLSVRDGTQRYATNECDLQFTGDPSGCRIAARSFAELNHDQDSVKDKA
jgi:hypothetical protein